MRQRHSHGRGGRQPAEQLRGWLHRDDFTSQFITTADDADHGAILMAATDWQAAVTALDHGLLPCSSGERHVLKLAASIAARTRSASATP